MHHLQIRLAIIAFFFGISIVLGYQFIKENHIVLPERVRVLAARLNISLPQPIQVNLELPEPTINTNELAEYINTQRQNEGLEELEKNSDLNKVAELLLKTFTADEFKIDQKDYTPTLQEHFKTVGYSYTAAANLAVVGPLDNDEVIESWSNPDNLSTLLSQDYAQIGIGYATPKIDGYPTGSVVAVFANPAPERSIDPNQDIVPALFVNDDGKVVDEDGNEVNPDTYLVQPATPAPFISDSEVLTALNQYRATHSVPQLVENQNLCTYAEIRAQDLKEFGGLDGHQGFRDDFDGVSEIPPGIRDYPGGAIAENLASQYCLNATTGESFVAETGTALIEWCFDSSVSGHREAQLNPKYTAACVRHADHLYVVIFGE